MEHTPGTALLHAATGFTVIHCNIQAQTEKALLIEVAHLDKPVWLPQSQLSYIFRYYKHSTGTDYKDVVHVKDWLVSKNNLEE